MYFDGVPRRNGHVRINTALSGAELFIPGDIAAEVTSSGPLGGTQAVDNFTRRGDVDCTPAALSGAGPLLRIDNTSPFGGLRIPSLPVATSV